MGRPEPHGARKACKGAVSQETGGPLLSFTVEPPTTERRGRGHGQLEPYRSPCPKES